MKIKNYFLAACVRAGGVWSLASDDALADPGCANNAHIQRLACEFDLRDDFFTSSAQCFDVVNQDPVCISDAEAEFDDGLEECGDVLEARLDLCESLDDATYDPEFGPDFVTNFVNPLQIGVTIAPNPWFADGSWKAGRDGSEPGILLPFDPQVGDVFRQEVAYGEAEDAIEILSITADEAAPGGATPYMVGFHGNNSRVSAVLLRSG